MKKLIVLVLAGGIMVATRADKTWLEATTDDGLKWAYNIVDGGAVIVGREYYTAIPNYPYYNSYTYEFNYALPSIPSNTVGAVTIPAELNGYPVIGISSYAFHDCSEITSLSIPPTITNIVGRAFSECKKLHEVHIDDLEMLYSRIHFGGAHFFSGAQDVDLYVGGVLTTQVEIPEGVTSINAYAFYNWRNLTKVELPSSVTNIGSYAFYGCSGLERIEFPENLSAIGSYAFYGCGLTDVSIPPNMPIIGERAFGGCGNLKSMELASFRFKSADGGSLYSDWANRLSNIVDASNVTNLIFESGIETIQGGVSAFTNLTSITIPESVTNIAANAFDNCSRLQTEWTKALAKLSVQGIGSGARYDLAGYVADRTIASVTVDRDAAIDEFVLTEGKVFDCAIRIVNASSAAVHITLPEGYTYESFVGAAPLTIPPNSTNMLTITRTGTDTFLVSRRQLQAIGR